jgi:5-formyltetrahydrofolate cyclo-ligase
MMDKAQLRIMVKDALGQLTDQSRKEKSKKICHNFTDTEQFKRASVIMVYLSLPHEVDTTSAILSAWQHEKTVAVPKVSWEQRHMIPVEITSLETGIEHNGYGLRTPATSVPMPIDEIDLVVTPGLAFDKHGNRLGRGGAYYDRFFQSEQLKAEKCGFAFTQQLVESVPADEYDKPVDFLITDEGVIKCR